MPPRLRGLLRWRPGRRARPLPATGSSWSSWASREPGRTWPWLPWDRAASRTRRTVAAKPSIGSSRSSMRVVPAWLASPMKIESPATVRPDLRADRHRRSQVHQTSSLFDVEFDVRMQAGHQRWICAELRWILTGVDHCLVEGDSVGIGQRAGPVRLDGAGQEFRPETGDTKPGPFLFGEGNDRDRSAGPQSLLIEQVEGSESRRQPEGPVESAPIGVPSRDGFQQPRCHWHRYHPSSPTDWRSDPSRPGVAEPLPGRRTSA